MAQPNIAMEEPVTVESIQKLARRLAVLPAAGNDEQALLGFAVGAAYSLETAVRFGYTVGATAGARYLEDIRCAARAVSQGKPPATSEWMAGFYFNSCLLRLAALSERIGKYATGNKWDLTPKVRRDVNHMKHDIDVLLAEGREATLHDAKQGLDEIVTALEMLFGPSK